MAVDKLVDSTQLDACCTAEANAIRAKTGGSSQIAYDWANSKGFADAIAAIPSGTTPTGTTQISITANGMTTHDVTNYANAEVTVNVTGDEYAIARKLAANSSTLTEYRDPSATSLQMGAFYNRKYLTKCIMHNVTSVNLQLAFSGNNASNYTQVHYLAFPKLTSVGNYALANNTGIYGYDLAKVSSIATYGMTKTGVNKLVLRKADAVVSLAHVNAFNQTPFASGGAGGTIYIPKALYDHLDDGTSLDYKAATNWSTLNGYGTITWAQIEGSAYENTYLDGEPIPTT